MEVLGNLSRTLLNIASNPATKTGKQLDASGEALLSAISSVMDASLFTGRETSESNGLFRFFSTLYKLETCVLGYTSVMAKGDGREVGFHDGGCF